MKAKLQAIKEGDNNAYNHLIQVLKQMILNNDQNGYQLFEHYSQNVKNNVQLQQCFRGEQYEQLQDYVKQFKGLLNKPNTGTQEEPQEPGPCGYVANLMEEAKLFQKAGVGFGEEFTYVIFKALERFTITKEQKQVKFWGSIAAQEKDYFIIETAAAQGGQQGEMPPEVEPKGTGVNKNTYWVTTDLLSGVWRELPNVTPDQINASRKIKYVFSGKLDKQICMNPHFNGKESHLLKCQITRINFSCSIVPRTMYNVNAEDKKEIEPAAEEWKLPGFSFLSCIDNWVHHPQNILKNGRLTLLKPNIPEGVEVDEEKLMKDLQLKDPLEDRLKPISQDCCGKEEAWALKVVGDTSEYRTMSKAKETVNYGYICIKSLVWKGWTLVYHNKQWSSIYIGSGNKTKSEWYFPKEPEEVLCECPDHEEQPQPTIPKEAPKEEEKPPEDE